MTLRCLTSFAFFRNTDMAELVAGLCREYGGPVEIFADSGAFSVANAGATVKLADYAAWLREWQDVITTAATLDVIGDADATARNTEALASAGLDVLPTFHVGTSWPVLADLCSRHPYLALGGMVPFRHQYGEVMRWLIRAFLVGREHGVVFHGFGQTRLSTTSALPFYSVDSSSWLGNAHYGKLVLWDAVRSRRVMVQTGRRAEAVRFSTLLREHGADPDVVGRPGFALSSCRTAEEHSREYTMLQAASMRAFHRFGQWLQHRHDVTPPPGWTSRGTCLFLACSDPSHARLAARVLGGAG